MSLQPKHVRIAGIATGVYSLAWLGLVFDWMAFDWFSSELRLAGLATGVVVAGLWIWLTRQSSVLVRSFCFSLAYIPCWSCAVIGADYLMWQGMRSNLAQIGLGGFYLIGLVWVIWALERLAEYYEGRRARERNRARDEGDSKNQPQATRSGTAGHVLLEGYSDKAVHNPLDPAAWYYGRRGKKLNQSITALMSYSGLFTLIAMLLANIRGCGESFDMPAGGGGPGKAETMGPAVTQTVKIQKKIKKKFVINPFSSISYNTPPIEEIELNLLEITRHEYSVSAGSGGPGGSGFGDGEGDGYAGGTGDGKIHFVRLEYDGGDWNQDFGVGADLNMLIQFQARTGQKVHHETESRRISQLRNMAPGKAPPFVYMTGQRSISVSESDKKTLRDYLLNQHGMIFCDNGGSEHFHNQFVQMMNDVLERKIEPVLVPADDILYRIKNRIEKLPYVALHNPGQVRAAIGWKVDGRWVAYYSPGDIADAWSDGHSGVKPEVTESCYQLGENVILYAYREKSKWLRSRAKK